MRQMHCVTKTKKCRANKNECMKPKSENILPAVRAFLHGPSADGGLGLLLAATKHSGIMYDLCNISVLLLLVGCVVQC